MELHTKTIMLIIRLDSSLPRRVVSSGGSRGGTCPATPYFLDQTEARRAEKNWGRSLRSFLRYADDTKPIRTREWMHDQISSHDFSINAYLHQVFSSYRPVLLRLQQNWNLEVLVFKERGKPEYPEKNLSGRGREPTTNSTHMWRPRQDSNRGRIGGRRVLSPLRHPLLPEATENHLHTPLNSTWTCHVP